jgi:signal transduction histidine kinase
MVLREERARIARELHDVVAHAMSVIVLQARGARHSLPVRPEETREALDAVERAASHGLAEMRRLLSGLRDDGEAAALAPQPSVDHIDMLVAHVRAAGLPVEVRVEGASRELPAGIDLCGYRIVQEALTNALRHAGPASARIVVRYGERDLELEVSDDGAGMQAARGAAPSGTGHGLVGMRERLPPEGRADAAARGCGSRGRRGRRDDRPTGDAPADRQIRAPAPAPRSAGGARRAHGPRA